MSDFPTTMLLPWAAIFAAALLAWCPRLRVASLILALVGYGAAFALGQLAPIALAPLAGLALAAWAIAGTRAWPLRIAGGVLFTVLGYALSQHWLPGFHNLRVIHALRVTPDAVPFTMYLNADKALVGLWLLWVLPSAVRAARWSKAVPIGAAAAAGTALVCLAVALTAGAVGFAPKWPAFGWLWLVNNLLIVALAEEAFYRGWVQRGLEIALARVGGGQWLAVLVASLLFAATHASGGIALIGFATLAGIGYGLAYRFGGLRAAWLAHAGFDLIHFALFTYPLRAATGA
ncbi:CPBP family intramembrane glutamic endopeptidase [Burkholderia gladioli]|uniref:CPBP family intramembrane glutamic endopeptidase n=1 Tax=Burkholderia gladioli TaxID=28095 RepID=UPI001641A1DA|nr:CPBP family intramembrane glutamic endopeptidase [Burkholderia gladioli]MBU9320240.1 CPBP family intramembrane metalloprotease [Burkholderia gladioli]